mmetsp:Transcript_1073/g.1079  ORF Transcript_1073/g.1079 Transcript_1073/m.1079 type:complete len:117 (-) Transcript_1073:19-369(-)
MVDIKMSSRAFVATFLLLLLSSSFCSGQAATRSNLKISDEFLEDLKKYIGYNIGICTNLDCYEGKLFGIDRFGNFLFNRTIPSNNPYMRDTYSIQIISDARLFNINPKLYDSLNHL